MKTTIKSFLVAAVAATTLFSCAKEIESPEGAVPGNPGDVQISIGLGGGGATTYATQNFENVIASGSAVLYKADGSAVIPMVNPRIIASDATGNGAKFEATVSAENVIANPDAILCLYVNGTPTPAAPATLTDMLGATVVKTLSRSLANTATPAVSTGIPASTKLAVKLVGGNTISTAMQVRRVASRIGAVTTGASINGYKITLTRVNTTSGKLFPGTAKGADGTATVTEIGLTGTTTDMYNGSEAVAYVYPSTKSQITVIPAEGKGDPKTVDFEPIAGKNYTIKITPKLNEDGSFNNSISIEAWDADIDIPVDMNPTKELAEVVIDPTVAADYTKYKDGVSVKAGINNPLMDIQLLANRQPVGTQGVLDVKLVATFAAADAPTAENPLSIKTGTVGQSTIFGIATLADYTGVEVKKTLKVTYMAEADGAPVIVRYLNIYLQPGVVKTDLEKLLVNIGGNLWMPFNTSGVLADDEAIATAILAAAGADNYAKAVNYAYASPANFIKAQGKFFAGTAAATSCPAGYKIASIADWDALAGNATVPTSPAASWGTGNTQQFTNSTLTRTNKSITGIGAGYYNPYMYTFTSKAVLEGPAGQKLSLFQTRAEAPAGYPATLEPGAGGTIWTGNVGTGANVNKVQRVVAWDNGFSYNFGPQANTSNVRCVKVK